MFRKPNPFPSSDVSGGKDPTQLKLLGTGLDHWILLMEATDQDTLVGGNGSSFRNMRAIQRVTSSELLTKREMRKKNLLYTKLHTYLSYFTSSHHRN
jgi:hypothetical protein